MDGNYPNNDELIALVRAWMHQNESTFSTKKVVGIHVTSILGINMPIKIEEKLIGISLLVFHKVIEEVKATQMRKPLIALLVIPLENGKTILTRRCPSSLEEMYSELSHEPPSIYLISSIESLYSAAWEEYRCPFPFILQKHENETLACYREHRSAYEIHNNWEYSRDICLHKTLG